jgi:hypothetical protein
MKYNRGAPTTSLVKNRWRISLVVQKHPPADQNVGIRCPPPFGVDKISRFSFLAKGEAHRGSTNHTTVVALIRGNQTRRESLISARGAACSLLN